MTIELAEQQLKMLSLKGQMVKKKLFMSYLNIFSTSTNEILSKKTIY